MRTVTLDSYAVDARGCWVWQRAISTGGYGRLGDQYAHRLSYERHVGPIPAGLQIDHLCRNRACINPAHLEAVTQRANILRGESPTIMVARSGMCMAGHQLTPGNTYVRPDNGRRQCRTCRRTRRAAYRLRTGR